MTRIRGGMNPKEIRVSHILTERNEREKHCIIPLDLIATTKKGIMRNATHRQASINPAVSVPASPGVARLHAQVPGCDQISAMLFASGTLPVPDLNRR